MKKHPTKKTIVSVLLVSGILLVAAVLLFFALRADRLADSVQVEHGGEQLTRQPITSIEHNGEWYKLRKDVQTVLLIRFYGKLNLSLFGHFNDKPVVVICLV